MLQLVDKFYRRDILKNQVEKIKVSLIRLL